MAKMHLELIEQKGVVHQTSEELASLLKWTSGIIEKLEKEGRIGKIKKEFSNDEERDEYFLSKQRKIFPVKYY